MLDRLVIQEFLTNSVTPETFPVFAAISNLSNLDNQRTIIDLLALRKINLTDLQSMRMIDDIAVAEFLDNYNKFKLPYLNDNIIPSQNAHGYLLDGETPLTIFLQTYNEFINAQFGKEEEVYRVNGLKVSFEDSIYLDDTDFELDFQKKVVDMLCAENSIIDVSSLINPIVFSLELSVDELGLVQRIHDFYLKSFIDSFSNANLSKLFVWNDERPSIVLTQIATLNELANLKMLSPIVDHQLSSDIFDMSIREALVYAPEELLVLWQELYSIELGKQPLTNIIAYIRYRIAFINTLEQKNNGTIKSVLETAILQLVTYFKEYMTLHNTLESIINSRLNVKTI